MTNLEENLVHSTSEKEKTVKRDRCCIHGLVIVLICCISAGAGLALFFSQRATELTVFKIQLDGTISQLQRTIQLGISKKQSASRLLNKIYAYAAEYGYGTTYGQSPPFFLLPGIQNYTLELMTLGDVRGTEWHPLVDNNTRPAWELWTKEIIKTQGLSPSVFHTVNNTAYKYGICIFTSPTTRARVSGTISGGDPRFSHWLFPLWQGGSLTPPAVGAIVIFLDAHSWPGTRFQTVEKILAAGYGGGGAFTDVVQLGGDVNFRPSTNFYSVVYSNSAKPRVLGITNLFFSWDSLLVNALPNNLKRVDCVLTTKTTTSTLAVDQGTVIIVGKGDFHDSAMSSYGQSIALDVSDDNVVSPLAASAYTLTVYPSSAFYNQYITQGPVQLGIVLAVVIFVVLSMMYVIRIYYGKQQERIRCERDRWEKSQEEAYRAQEDAKKAEIDRERERRLRHELQENIANSAHDIKSPTTALGLAVESLLDALDNNKPMTDATRQRVVETLHGMAHTIAALTMIINRSVDASNSASGSFRSIVPNNVPVDLEKVMDEVMAFSKWQAEDTGIEVVMEPLPADLPDEIMIDEKWLKDDLLCAASNAVKYSRANQKVPALVRVAIVHSPTQEKGVANLPIPPSVQFSFIDSGYPLSDDRLTSLFNRPVHSERTQIGGMGLGLYCLREHIDALKGQYGARRRSDCQEGTEIWFSFPLIAVEADLDQFVVNDIECGLRNGLMNGVNNTAVKPLFSSPQNRRSSTMKLSQKSQNSSMPTITPRDCGLLGGADGQTTGPLPFVTTELNALTFEAGVAMTDGATADIAAGEHPPRGLGSNSSSTADRMLEVLGSSPILLVDDSVSILKMTKRAIQNECASICFMEAKNGEEAFERVVEAFASFELIVTDIQMPICGGFEFTRRVRQLEQDKGLTPKMIIGISANDQQKIAEEAKASGMDGFMHKPFKLATLMNVIEDISNRSKEKKSVLFHGRATTETKLPPVVANSVTDVRDAGNVKTTGSGVVGNVTSSSCGRNNGLFAGKSILVVDDAVSILKLMSHTLINKAEAIVTQAKDGQQAVEECEKQHFDLILTDIQMPVLDGFGEARCIRAMEKERGLPRKIIIGISANTQDHMAVEAEEAGMDAFMNKPFKLEELTALYNKILVRYDRNQQDTSTQQATVTHGVTQETPSLMVVRGPRSIRNVTPNAKIFVDASELDDIIASQMGDDFSSLEQNGSSPTVAVAVAVSESEWKTAVSEKPATGNSNDTGNGMVSGIKYNNAKVHAAI